VQIVRNAVAHGIEPEAERRAAGKEATGRVSLDVFRRGKQIVFECRDDGRGIDLAAVRRVALQRGVAPEVVNGPGTQGLATLLLRGGISTSDAVTEVSGRGVGLAVVRDAIERLGGTVAVETEPGNGTSFRLAVPVTVMSLEALNVEAAGTIASIPLAAVRGTMRVVADAVTRTSSGATMLYEDGAIPFVWLGNALYGSSPVPGRTCSAVAVSAGAGTIAVGVDRLLGTATIVMRPLPDLAPASPIVSGTTLDAQGNPQLVLDPDGLFAAAQAAGAAASEPAKRSAPVLVIDDSLTTRMLEQGILESAGYEVDVAVSAEAGLERARLKRYGLFLVDVEMPGMDGFGFVERIRADPALHDIPAVLVTSRNAPEDLQRGRDIGAHGYIVKSEFDQAALLSLIRPLIG
jgi:two-component system chemotaxis sensor kinase CheA